MLGKLLKQEFRATGRIMLPVFGALLLLSVLANLSIRMLDRVDSRFLNFLFIFVIVAFVLGMFGTALMTLVLMITRFQRNLLRDEGYLMHTLPVSVHGLVGSKLIVSLVWFLVTGLILTLIVFLTGLIQTGTSLSELFFGLPSWTQIRIALTTQGITGRMLTRFIVEVLTCILVTTLASCLQFYAAMAIGHMFNKDKILLSIVFFVVISFVLSLLNTFIGVGSIEASYIDEIATVREGLRFAESSLLFALGLEAVEAALLYFATALSLRRGLNLG